MLHKGKLQAALNFKRGQFTAYDSSFIDQLQAYRHALETLYLRYPSAAQLEHVLPPDGSGMPPAVARSCIEVYRGPGPAVPEPGSRPLFRVGHDMAPSEKSPPYTNHRR